MIFAIEKMQSTSWLVQIEDVECLPSRGGELIRLALVGNDGWTTEIFMDEDAVAQHLYRAVGEFEDVAKLTGKCMMIVIDRLGDVVALYAPTKFDYEMEQNRCKDDAPAPPFVVYGATT